MHLRRKTHMVYNKQFIAILQNQKEYQHMFICLCMFTFCYLLFKKISFTLTLCLLCFSCHKIQKKNHFGKTQTNISEFYKEERKNRFLTLKLASSEVHFLFIWTTELMWKWFSRWPEIDFQFSLWCHCDQIFIIFFITRLVFNFLLLLLLPTKCSVWT